MQSAVGEGYRLLQETLVAPAPQLLRSGVPAMMLGTVMMSMAAMMA